MRDLHFTIDGQKLSKNGDFSNIVRETKGYLKCCFSFIGDDWKGHKVVAVFENSDSKEFAVSMNTDKTCMVPDEVTDGSYFKIKMIGVNDKRRILTNKILISQEG